MNDKQLRTKFWETLENDGRSFSWFHRQFISGKGLKYNTLYKQAKGQELTEMSDELREAMSNFLGV